MKIIAFIAVLLFALCPYAMAELYHGIDIDDVYATSDWSSKDDIKKIIDDYTLLLQYQEELNACPIELPEVLKCYDAIAEKILTDLYVQTEANIEDYKQLKKALSASYGLKNCRNKYAWPSGNTCEIDSDSDVANFLKSYIQDLINFCKEKMFIYSSILEEYK
jgi:hypothetical protein